MLSRRLCNAIALICILIASVFWQGCSNKKNSNDVEASASQPAASPAVTFATEKQTFLLAENLPAADAEPLETIIDFKRAEQKRFLTQGWNDFDPKAAQPGCWVADRGVVEVYLPHVEPIDFSITLSCSSAVRNLPGQTALLLWNGRRLGVANVKPKPSTFRMRLPWSMQRHGANRLQILPAYAIDSGRAGQRGPSRTLSVMVSEIRFDRLRPTLSSNRSAARAKGEDIWQSPDSTIVYDLLLPEKAVLTASGQLENASSITSDTVVLSINTGGKDERILGREKILLNQPFSIHADLSKLGGRMASLSLSYTRAFHEANLTTDSLPMIHWSAPKLEGTVKQLVPPDLASIKSGYNILLIVFDALRADYTEPGGDRITKTPAMQALAQAGVTFEQAHSQAPWTRPSVTSYLSSLRPNAHQVIHDADALPPTLPYLPEALRGKGYKTLYLCDNGIISDDYGFERGYDKLCNVFGDQDTRDPDPAKFFQSRWDNNIKPFLAQQQQKPFFIYDHEIDPHAPYAPQGNYANMYGVFEWTNLDQTRQGSDLISSGIGLLSPFQVEQYKSLYRGEISYMDAYLQQMIQKLEQENLRDNTLVIFMSDHGEEFYDHKGTRHARTLYEELTHVPLIFSLPGVLPEGKRVTRPVELIDVMPTIFDLMDEDSPSAMQGRSLLADLFCDYQEPSPEPIYSCFDIDASVRMGRWKLMEMPHAHNSDTFRLYNLRNDPKETTNLWFRQPIEGRVLRQMIARQHLQDVKVRTAAPVQKKTEEVKQSVRNDLEANGYL